MCVHMYTYSHLLAIYRAMNASLQYFFRTLLYARSRLGGMCVVRTYFKYIIEALGYSFWVLSAAHENWGPYTVLYTKPPDIIIKVLNFFVVFGFVILFCLVFVLPPLVVLRVFGSWMLRYHSQRCIGDPVVLRI